MTPARRPCARSAGPRRGRRATGDDGRQRLRVDTDHVERDVAREKRTRILHPRRTSDREGETLLLGRGGVDQDGDVAPDEHEGLRIHRGSERSDHRLPVDEDPEAQRHGGNKEHRQVRGRGQPVRRQVGGLRSRSDPRAVPREHVDEKPRAECGEAGYEQNREREEQRARSADVQDLYQLPL